MVDPEFHQVLQAQQFCMAVVALVPTLEVALCMEDLTLLLVAQITVRLLRTLVQEVPTA